MKRIVPILLAGALAACGPSAKTAAEANVTAADAAATTRNAVEDVDAALAADGPRQPRAAADRTRGAPADDAGR